MQLFIYRYEMRINERMSKILNFILTKPQYKNSLLIIFILPPCEPRTATRRLGNDAISFRTSSTFNESHSF